MTQISSTRTLLAVLAVAAMTLASTQAFAGAACSPSKPADSKKAATCSRSEKTAKNEKKAASKDDCRKWRDSRKEQLSLAANAIEEATKAIKAGDQKTALAKLAEAAKLVKATHKAISECNKAKFANVKCPIMGSPVVAEKVTKELTRLHKGQKVAFCCGGCPSAWDKLTDAEKNAKLSKVLPEGRGCGPKKRPWCTNSDS